jgi:hypothetical protein
LGRDRNDSDTKSRSILYPNNKLPLPTLWDKSYDSLITEVINNFQYVTQYGNIEDENITDENLKEIPSLMWGLYSEK